MIAVLAALMVLDAMLHLETGKGRERGGPKKGWRSTDLRGKLGVPLSPDRVIPEHVSHAWP